MNLSACTPLQTQESADRQLVNGELASSAYALHFFRKLMGAFIASMAYWGWAVAEIVACLFACFAQASTGHCMQWPKCCR